MIIFFRLQWTVANLIDEKSHRLLSSGGRVVSALDIREVSHLNLASYICCNMQMRNSNRPTCWPSRGSQENPRNGTQGNSGKTSPEVQKQEWPKKGHVSTKKIIKSNANLLLIFYCSHINVFVLYISGYAPAFYDIVNEGRWTCRVIVN